MSSPAPIRKRMKRRELPGNIRFITFSCYLRLQLFTNPAICCLFLDRLAAARDKHGFSLFAWVIMPEHIHMLMRPADGATLDRALLSFKLSFSKRVISRWRELRAPVLARIADPRGAPRLWQPGGGFDRNVRSPDEFCREIGYIHHNPVERGLVTKPDEWRWSSVHWWMGKREGQFPCDPPPGHPDAWARWTGYM